MMSYSVRKLLINLNFWLYTSRIFCRIFLMFYYDPNFAFSQISALFLQRIIHQSQYNYTWSIFEIIWSKNLLVLNSISMWRRKNSSNYLFNRISGDITKSLIYILYFSFLIGNDNAWWALIYCRIQLSYFLLSFLPFWYVSDSCDSKCTIIVCHYSIFDLNCYFTIRFCQSKNFKRLYIIGD